MNCIPLRGEFEDSSIVREHDDRYRVVSFGQKNLLFYPFSKSCIIHAGYRLL
jgi:hypothetical protein